MKRFAALARVSSREQEQQGFSLDVQVEALKTYATRADGKILKLFRIAETATRHQERATFKQLLAYVREHADTLDGLLFYKVDRAARNLFDYVELERIEEEHGVGVHYITQPTENTPAGRMHRRILANMAAYYTEQQALDVREGMARRVKSGLFPGRAPYGYRNVRRDGRSLVEIDEDQARNVRRIFELYAFRSLTLDALQERLKAEGVTYSRTRSTFSRTKLHELLCDRSYIGDVKYRGAWYPGTHQPIVDQTTWNRVQGILGGARYKPHDSTYGSGLMTCSHCGRPIVAEIKTKNTKTGERTYTYYRCADYTAKGHPRNRLPERRLDAQMIEAFQQFSIPEDVRDWIARLLHARSRDQQKENQAAAKDATRELIRAKERRDRLLNLRLMDEITSDTFTRKDAELAAEIAGLESRLAGTNRGQAEYSQLAVKAFELSQSLTEKWQSADIEAKRAILHLIGLNYTLDGETLIIAMQKPFELLAKGQILKDGRGGRI